MMRKHAQRCVCPPWPSRTRERNSDREPTDASCRSIDLCALLVFTFLRSLIRFILKLLYRVQSRDDMMSVSFGACVAQRRVYEKNIFPRNEMAVLFRLVSPSRSVRVFAKTLDRDGRLFLRRLLAWRTRSRISSAVIVGWHHHNERRPVSFGQTIRSSGAIGERPI